MNFIVGEGDKLCTPAMTHLHTVESIGRKQVTVSFKGKHHRIARGPFYEALSQGVLMVLERGKEE